MFGNKEDKQKRKEAEKKLESYFVTKQRMLFPTPQLERLLSFYNVNGKQVRTVGSPERKFLKKMYKTLKKDIKNGLEAHEIYNRIKELLTQEYGEQLTPEEVKQNTITQKAAPIINQEKKLEEKFGVQFKGKKWFRCTIEEIKASTISNIPQRQVDYAYVIIEDDHLDIIKESVFIKSKMGTKKIFFNNIASIDYDARGKLHISNSLVINLKSSDNVLLKNLDEKFVKMVQDAFNDFMAKDGSGEPVVVKAGSNADELLKYAELFEKGLLTKEEFEAKKKELL